MRKIIWGLVTVAMVFLCACSSEIQDKTTEISQTGDVITITAYSEAPSQTKTGVVDNGSGGKSVVWKSGNAISMFFNRGENGGSKFTTTTNGPIAEFTGTITAVSGDLSGVGGQAYLWGLYPYNPNASCNGSAITTTLPSNQLAYQGDVADDLLVTVGRSEYFSLYFKNTCAIIGFTIKQENITRVSFSGNADELVAGEFETSFDSSNNLIVTPTANAVKSIEITPAESSSFIPGMTYYFAILPQRFVSGYTLTFTKADNSSFTYERTTSFNFAISTFYTMTNKDSTPLAVDLGLSVKWASFNLGATSPEEVGEYYAWGEIAPKEEYSWDTYKWYDVTTSSFTKYTQLATGVLDIEDDAANANLRGNWRLPSPDEFEELRHNCDKTYTTINNLEVIVFQSKKNGNQIVLPCGGRMNGTELELGCGDYMTNEYGVDFISDPDHGTIRKPSKTHDVSFIWNSHVTVLSYSDRYHGLSVRPVCQ